eukprot:421128-Amphidinium_carterae.1
MAADHNQPTLAFCQTRAWQASPDKCRLFGHIGSGTRSCKGRACSARPGSGTSPGCRTRIQVAAGSTVAPGQGR